ncbi:MAG: sigma-70 family RNA polymerase sigma factor [Flavipsychrobacter sp.]
MESIFYCIFIENLLFDLIAKDRDINLTDDEIIALHRKANDNKWLGVLLERYTTLLLGVGIKYLKDKDASADAVQQVFLKVLTSLPSGEIKNFKGWLYILMRNHCFQVLRDNKQERAIDAFYDLPADMPASEAELYKQEAELTQMKVAIEELDEGQRECVKMFYLEKKSYQDIMTRYGYTFKQVKSYIQNGKRNLKKLIIERRNNGGNHE